MRDSLFFATVLFKLIFLLLCPLKTSCKISYSCDSTYPEHKMRLGNNVMMHVLYIVYFNFMTKCMLTQLFLVYAAEGCRFVVKYTL